ncbi:MAG: HAD hydrolase-like protein [Eubacteriales bacterium]|nr:HAD hydrolase-like protein [Eubacteriales bacterium]
MEKKYILFDLDGTLTDSYEGIINALCYSLSELGIAPKPEGFRNVIGPPLSHTYMDTYGMTAAESDRAVNIFHDYYESKGKFENHPYEGVLEMLQTLNAHGKKLMIATAKPEHMAVDIAEHFGLSPYLCFIAGVTDEGMMENTAPNVRKNKRDVLAYILKSNDIKDPENAVMVGDRAYDMTAAAELGLQTVGVLYGFGTEEELSSAGAQYLAGSPLDVTKYIIES